MGRDAGFPRLGDPERTHGRVGRMRGSEEAFLSRGGRGGLQAAGDVLPRSPPHPGPPSPVRPAFLGVRSQVSREQGGGTGHGGHRPAGGEAAQDSEVRRLWGGPGAGALEASLGGPYRCRRESRVTLSWGGRKCTKSVACSSHDTITGCGPARSLRDPSVFPHDPAPPPADWSEHRQHLMVVQTPQTDLVGFPCFVSVSQAIKSRGGALRESHLRGSARCFWLSGILGRAWSRHGVRGVMRA